MTSQISLRFNDDFLKRAKTHARLHGFLNVQEFIRETLREKLYDELELNKEYMQRLHSKDAQTFVSEEEAQSYEKELENRANL